MPPKPKHKKKVKKTSPSVIVNTNKSTTEMSKDELWNLALQLQKELDMIMTQRRDLPPELNKAQTSWDTTKKNLVKERAKLRNRRSVMEEDLERGREDTTFYQQKLKRVLSEQSNTITGLKLDIASSSSLLRHTESELDLRKQVHVLQADCREKQINQKTLIKNLMLKQHKEMIKLGRDYDFTTHNVELKCHNLTETVEQRRLQKLQRTRDETNETMERRVASLIEDQDVKTTSAHFHLSLIHKNFKCMQSNEMLLRDLKLELKFEDIKLNQELSKNRHLREQLSKLEEEWDELQRTSELKSCKDTMTKFHRQLKVVEREHTDLTVKLELLRQAVQEAEEERDALQKKQRETICDVQQKNRLKRMILERKIAAVTETLEKQQAQLYAALSIFSRDPETRCNSSKKLKELMESKDKRISALQEEIIQDTEEYNKLLHDTKESWKASGNLLYKSPFRKTRAPSSALSS